MARTWHIRKAKSEDSDGLNTCMEAAYSAYENRMGRVRLPPLDVDYLSEIVNHPTWVVESKGTILGGLIMVFEEHQASIANIAVDPKFHGNGIGGELIAIAESEARENNFSELLLSTHVLLTESISLYQHLGWEETGRNETKVFMTKRV